MYELLRVRTTNAISADPFLKHKRKISSAHPSQAAIICGVVAGIVDSVFGPNVAVPFTVTDLADPKLKRDYKGSAEMASEHSNMRVWGGIHFRNSLEVGEDMGKKIAA